MIYILLIILFAFCFLLYKWSAKPVQWSPKEVADLLQSWVDGKVDDRGWDYFESCEISNPHLESIRQEALAATLFESPLIDIGPSSSVRLNADGLIKFNDLIFRCNQLDS